MRQVSDGEEKGVPQQIAGGGNGGNGGNGGKEEKGVPRTLAPGALKDAKRSSMSVRGLLKDIKAEGKEGGEGEGKEGGAVKKTKTGWGRIKQTIDTEREAMKHLNKLGAGMHMSCTVSEAMDALYRAEGRVRILKRQSQRKLHPARKTAVKEAMVRGDLRLKKAETTVAEAKARQKVRNSQVKKKTALVAEHKLQEIEKARQEAGEPPLGCWARRKARARLAVEFHASVVESFEMSEIRRIPLDQRMIRAVRLAEVKLKPKSGLTKWLYHFNPNVKQADAFSETVPSPVHVIGVHFMVFLALAYLAFANYYLIGFAMYNGAETTMAWMQVRREEERRRGGEQRVYFVVDVLCVVADFAPCAAVVCCRFIVACVVAHEPTMYTHNGVFPPPLLPFYRRW